MYQIFLESPRKNDFMVDEHKLVDLQREIWSKYHTIQEVSTNNLSPKNFINFLDKYILHTIEEIAEAQYEQRQHLTTDTHSFREEVMDVFMYLGTIASILKQNVYMQLDDPFIFVRTSDKSKEFILENDWLGLILGELILIRRKFPERKWHKSTEPISRYEYDRRIFECYLIVRESLRKCATFLLYLHEYNLKKINEEYTRKYKEVFKLPDPSDQSISS